MLRQFREVWSLLGEGSRRGGAILLVLVLGTAVFEVLGVASILPFLAVVADPEGFLERPALRWVYEGLGLEDRQTFLVLLGVAVFLVSVVAQALKALTTYRSIRFSTEQQHEISARLFEAYLGQPYEWFITQHSSDLAKVILSETDLFIQQVLLPLLRVIASGVVLLAIVGLLLATEPVVAMSAGLALGVAYGAVYVAARKRLAIAGARRLQANTVRYKNVHEAFGGIKEVKSNALEGPFLSSFSKVAEELAHHTSRGMLMHSLPRYFLEALVIAGMLTLVLALLLRGDGSINSALPVLGLFALATARMFPALQEVYAGLAKIKLSKPTCDALRVHLAMRPEPLGVVDGVEPITLREVLEFRDVEYAYPSSDQPAVSLSMTIPAHSSVGLVGSTGAGKTTTVDLLLGLLVPTRGEVVVDGVLLADDSRRRWRRSVGYVPQHTFLADTTVAGNVAFGVDPKKIDLAAVRRACAIAQLDEFITNELPAAYDTLIGERGIRLSGGQRQRIGIARALYRDPSILIFDEATSALDNVTERKIMEAIRASSGSKTIVYIAHRLSTIRECDSILVLERGRVVARGTYDELLKNSPLFRRLALVDDEVPEDAPNATPVTEGAARPHA